MSLEQGLIKKETLERFATALKSKSVLPFTEKITVNDGIDLLENNLQSLNQNSHLV